MAEDLGEGTEDATPKRRREAREEGNIARSQDAANAMLLFGAVLVLSAGIKPMLTSLASMLTKSLGSENMEAMRAEDITTNVAPTVVEASLAAAPVVLGAAAVGVLAHLWQVGFLVTDEAARAQARAPRPDEGIREDLRRPRRHQDRHGLLQGGRGRVDRVEPRHGGASRDRGPPKQQVKDEWKESEGDPKIKQRRMQIARQLAMQRLQTAVPKADVIVTNPEHISVAIQYDANSMQAPRIVAMGADHLAFRIRQIAMKHAIPIVERKPLARALYANAKVGQEIPPDHYKAVAEILAYVYRLKGKAVA